MRWRTAAVALCLALTASPAAAGERPGSRPGPPARVERLYAQAARAVQAYEDAERAVRVKRADLRLLHRAASVERHRLSVLRDRIGAMARSEYRNGALGSSTWLLLARRPERLLAGVTLARQGDHLLAALLAERRLAERRLAADTEAVDRTLTVLAREARRKDALRRRIEARLLRARARLSARDLAAMAHGGLSAHCPRDLARSAARSSAAPGRRSAPRWVRPVARYTLTAGYDASGAHWAHRHTGQDFAVPPGTPVRAVGGGTVVVAACGDGFGNQIVVRHDDGYCTHYAHLSVLEVVPGQRVRAGERIGRSGNSGNSTGPHLHFEVRVTPQMGSSVAPLPWLARHGVRISG
ncbi:M23 family metallopeptidase [Streptomyces sp. ME03-5709C]|nr:M23 family metallopeptidase [Streptomyces sp. ME03-5709C]